jgi:hypothetical protein
MSYKFIILFLCIFCLSCKTDFSSLNDGFCSEDDIYEGYTFTFESVDTLDYLIEMHYEIFSIITKKRIDSSKVFFNDILLNLRWNVFNDSSSYCSMDFNEIEGLSIIPNVPIKVDFTFNDVRYIEQISFPNKPKITSTEFTKSGKYHISWELSSHADTQNIFVSVRDVDKTNFTNIGTWQYSGLRRCHVLSESFVKNIGIPNYEIKVSINPINYINKKRFLIRAHSWDFNTAYN